MQKKKRQQNKMAFRITSSGEDYLETILVLQKKYGTVRSIDVAQYMDVSKPSVCHAVATLRDSGFLTMDEDCFLYLTDAGFEIAKKSTNAIAFLASYLSPQVLTLKQRKLTPAGWNILSAQNLLKNFGIPM